MFLFLFTSCSSTKLPDELNYLIKKYPELKEMEESYEHRNLDPESIDISQDLKKYVFPSFIQWDKRWAFLEYNGSFMAQEGNIPTAMSSIYTKLTGDTSLNPYEMGRFFEKRKWTINNMGTSWNAIEKGSLELGLEYKVISSSKLDIDNSLSTNKILLASVGRGDFTKDSGLVIIYAKQDGKYKISDPLSKINSNKLWSYEKLQEQIIHLWAFSKM